VESPSPTESPANRRRARTSRIAAILWTILIVGTLYVCYFTQLNAVGLVGPDEPRYAWIARDMAESGDFITPRLYGKPWFEKPPLYYWSAALSFRLFGVRETTARLPSAIFALLTTLAMGWLAWRVYNAHTARWLLLVLPTSFGMIGFSHAAATDMPFTATLTLAMLAAAILLGLIPRSRIERMRSTSFTSFIFSTSFISALFGFVLGLAVLAKGPAALILCGGAVLFWALFTKRWDDTRRLLHPTGIVTFCFAALPWYVLCAVRNPDFVRVFLIEHNFKRFLTPEFQHLQPFWYYGGIVLIALVPWTAAMVWAVVVGIDRVRRGTLSPSTRFLLCWSVFCVAFFTISRSKLPGYILPAVPPIALLLARACTLLAPAKRWSLALSSLTFSAICVAGFVAVLRNSDRVLRNAVAFKPSVLLILLLLVFANFLFGALLALRRPNAALVAAILLFFPAFWAFGVQEPFTPLSLLSSRYLADQLRAYQVPVNELQVFKLRRATLYGLNFYLHSDLQEWRPDPSSEIYVFAQGQFACPKNSDEFDCSDLWRWIDKEDRFQLFRLTPKR
jgi:4-amino-4-deoxy-L-arabinose transferase-like glycosyltransferase